MRTLDVAVIALVGYLFLRGSSGVSAATGGDLSAALQGAQPTYQTVSQAQDVSAQNQATMRALVAQALVSKGETPQLATEHAGIVVTEAQTIAQYAAQGVILGEGGRIVGTTLGFYPPGVTPAWLQ